MKTVKVSPKFQVVIPLEIRKSLGIKPGMKVHVLQYENRIEYIPVKEMKKSDLDKHIKRESKDKDFKKCFDHSEVERKTTQERKAERKDSGFPPKTSRE